MPKRSAPSTHRRLSLGERLEGRALMAADFNRDGYEDLVVGAPSTTVSGKANAGEVVVTYGARGGAYAAVQVLSKPVLGLVPSEDTGAIVDHGAVQVMYSNGRGLSTARALLVLQSAFPDPVESGDRFGFTVAAGDFDGDGVDDLAIGTPFEDVGAATDAGAVEIIFGRVGGLNFGRTVHLTQSGGSETGDHYGAALGVLDFDGDGWDDLAIGVPDEDIASVDEGAVELRLLNGAIAVYLDEYILRTGAGNGFKFGSSFASRRR